MRGGVGNGGRSDSGDLYAGGSDPLIYSTCSSSSTRHGIEDYEYV